MRCILTPHTSLPLLPPLTRCARCAPPTGYIDLSKRRVSAEEVIKCEEQYEKSKAVDSIIIQVAKKHNLDPEVLYRGVVWPLGKKYGHAHDAFKIAVA